MQPELAYKPELVPDPAPIVVADPRSFMRGCLLAWLSALDRGRQAFATMDAVQAITAGTVRAPAAIILSACPNPAGCAWLNQQAAGVRQVYPEVPIIVISDEAGPAGADEMTITAGCQGWISMTNTPEIAAAVLQLVIAGGHYLPKGQSARRRKTDRPATEGFTLTPRERAVCELLSEGVPNKIIARRLGMAVGTVKLHVHHVLKKMGVQNRTELALRMGSGERSFGGHLKRTDLPRTKAGAAQTRVVVGPFRGA